MELVHLEFFSSISRRYLRALMDKGLVKAENFRSSQNKFRYLYKLTPRGLEEKARMTYVFLKRKQREYEELKEEIAELKKEANVADKDG